MHKNFKFGGNTAATRNPESFARFPDPLAAPALEHYWPALQVAPISSIEWRCAPAWSLGPRIVPDTMYFYIHGGRAKGSVEDTHFELQRGDLMLIPKGASHTMIQEKGHPVHLSATHFHAHVFGGVNLIDLLGFPAHIRLKPRRDDIVTHAAEALDREFALKAPGFRQAAAAWLTTLLLHIARHFGSDFRPPYSSDRSQELRRLLPAFDYLERNLADGEVAVGNLARTVFVSEVQFRKLFRRVTGMSPARYIQSRRVERACRLLRESDVSVEQAALAAGFSDSAFFCRVFKAWTHATPSEYRKTAV
jgi:AraC-like DNA-binding protein